MDNYFKKKGQIVKKIKMNTPIQLCFCNDSYASTVIEAMIKGKVSYNKWQMAKYPIILDHRSNDT